MGGLAKELEKRLTYERLAGSISFLALKEKGADAFLAKSLRILGEGLAVSRAYFFIVDWKKKILNNTHEWVAKGITPQKENLQAIPLDEVGWWMDRLTKGEMINYEDIEAIPDERTKEILRPQGIKSLLVMPVFLGRKLYAFIGYDDCQTNRNWSQADLDLLQVVVSVIELYLQQKNYQEKIIYLSCHDSLTGLYNRRFMEEKIKELDRVKNLPLTAIMADINGLKLVNDVFGHNHGDKLLRKAANLIKNSFPGEGFAGRWGGDEFLILLPKTGAKKAEEIIRIINKSFSKNKTEDYFSLSLGYAVKENREGSFRQMAREAEEAMYRRKLLEGRSNRSAVVKSLLAALAERSMETEAHAERLRCLCLAVGKKLKLSSKEMADLSLLAVLHDIGKVAIKESILKKPGPLTEEEWQEMKKHPEVGCRIAQNIWELTAIAEYILFHHERWDGRGYPRGLKGEEIPMLCRILAVADAFDAMTSDRTYRRALGKEEALQEIIKNSGTQFAPDIVEIFLQIVDDKNNVSMVKH